MLDTSSRTGFNEEHALFRDTVRKVIDRGLIPNLDKFDEDGVVSREFWLECGAAGLLCPSVAEAYGGLELDFRYNVIVTEEVSYSGSSVSVPLQNDVVVDYIEAYGTDKQKRLYLPKMIDGSLIVAIGMTEPGTGSDLQAIKTSARRDGDTYVINGSKVYITNGQLADLVIVVTKTVAAARSKSLSLILVEAGCAGFERGRNLKKIGQPSADTSELFFHDVVVPAENLLGHEGAGFGYLMGRLPQERLSIAVAAQAVAQRAFDEALAFVQQRPAFGKTVFDFQNTRFVLADCKSQLQAGWAYLDWAIDRQVRGVLTTAEASALKQWHTDMQARVTDAALQLHGGAGYMNEYLVGRLWRDSRATRIYGGTNEIMKEVVGRSLATS